MDCSAESLKTQFPAFHPHSPHSPMVRRSLRDTQNWAKLAWLRHPRYCLSVGELISSELRRGLRHSCVSPSPCQFGRNFAYDECRLRSSTLPLHLHLHLSPTPSSPHPALHKLSTVVNRYQQARVQHGKRKMKGKKWKRETFPLHPYSEKRGRRAKRKKRPPPYARAHARKSCPLSPRTLPSTPAFAPFALFRVSTPSAPLCTLFLWSA